MTALTEHVIDWVRLDSTHGSPLMFGGNRWGFLPDLFNWAGFTRGAEIGVGGGRFSKRLLQTVEGLKLYSIDPWEAHDYYDGRVAQWRMDAFHRRAEEALAPYNSEIIREYSHLAAPTFEAGSLDFVYIDADRRLASVVRDLSLWSAKVRPGGVVSGCCYYNDPFGQVKDAVDAWTKANGIKPWFVIVHHRYPVYFWEVR
jgi:predicted O-methyltransferase YrrM